MTDKKIPYTEALEVVFKLSTSVETELGKLMVDDAIDKTATKLTAMVREVIDNGVDIDKVKAYVETYGFDIDEGEYAHMGHPLVSAWEVEDIFNEAMEDLCNQEMGARSVEETEDSLARAWSNGTL